MDFKENDDDFYEPHLRYHQKWLKNVQIVQLFGFRNDIRYSNAHMQLQLSTIEHNG